MVSLREVVSRVNLENIRKVYTLRAGHSKKSQQSGVVSTALQLTQGVPISFFFTKEGIPVGEGAAFLEKMASGGGTLPKGRNASGMSFAGMTITDFLSFYGDREVHVGEVTASQAEALDGASSDLHKPAAASVKEAGGFSAMHVLESKIKQICSEHSYSVFGAPDARRLDAASLLALMQAGKLLAYHKRSSDLKGSEGVPISVSPAIRAGSLLSWEHEVLEMASSFAREGSPIESFLYVKSRPEELWSSVFQDQSHYDPDLLSKGKMHPLVVFLFCLFREETQARLYRAQNEVERAFRDACLASQRQKDVADVAKEEVATKVPKKRSRRRVSPDTVVGEATVVSH